MTTTDNKYFAENQCWETVMLYLFLYVP